MVPIYSNKNMNNMLWAVIYFENNYYGYNVYKFYSSELEHDNMTLET